MQNYYGKIAKGGLDVNNRGRQSGGNASLPAHSMAKATGKQKKKIIIQYILNSIEIASTWEMTII